MMPAIFTIFAWKMSCNNYSQFNGAVCTGQFLVLMIFSLFGHQQRFAGAFKNSDIHIHIHIQQ